MPHPPIRFAFGVHLHQPVGQFDNVFQQHLDETYAPFLERVEQHRFLPVVLHISGPLLEWLEQHGTAYLDRLGRLVADGRVELLLAGMYEPVLAALPRRDRVEQIGWLREALQRRFGVTATGLWLTERVWEPELAADLADAGVRYALVDDRHFLVTGFTRDQLYTPWITESDGRQVTLFPIDERLRYQIPFRPPAETAAYLRELRAAGRPLAVFADDGEKFGGWPGTREWVYDRGWLEQFCSAIRELVDSGDVKLTTLSEALATVPAGGLAYLPSASYREMEAWSLPPGPAVRLAALEKDVGDERLLTDSPLIRGAHWRNFMVRYGEANRMHKKMMLLSAHCRAAGDPPAARRAIGRAQCNDAYWHGVFGGLYLPLLRDGIWKQLSIAEAILRAGEPLAWERLDYNADGRDELWIHDATFSAILDPAHGLIEEFTVFAHGINYGNTLTRRREAYHYRTDGVEQQPGTHDPDAALRLDTLPPIDREERVLVRERALAVGLTHEGYQQAEYQPLWQAHTAPLRLDIASVKHGIELTWQTADRRFEKRYQFLTGGGLRIHYRWDPTLFGSEALFAPEISLGGPGTIVCTPETDCWTHEILTVSKSEKALEQSAQGRSLTPRWPATLGAAQLEFRVTGWP